MRLRIWYRLLLCITIEILSVEAIRATTLDSLVSSADSLGQLSTIERLFGKGGIKFKLRGGATLGGHVRLREVHNPLLLPQDRRGKSFEFDQQINASLEASLGERLRLRMGYNTSATVSQDARSLKLSYEGKTGDLVKLVEVGNLSFKPANSLMQYGSSLFGVRTRLEYGALRLDLIASQQRSHRQTTRMSQGSQLHSFSLNSSAYDARRHFFLSDLFRSQYEEVLSQLPRISSEVQIRRLEIWVTNKSPNYSNARNILAFADLGEHRRVHNEHVHSLGGESTANESNDLYSQLKRLPLENGALVSSQLPSHFTSGLDYEQVSSARLLAESEYFLHPSLGFISLRQPLGIDESLSVAYEYSYRGKTYRVGELSADHAPNTTLIVKLLKGSNPKPSSPHWHFMMRNVYQIGSGQIDARSLEFNLLYRTAENSLLSPYLPDPTLAKQPLIQLLGLDRNSHSGTGQPDGRLDVYEGISVHSQWGLVYLPSLEPFGKSLEKSLGSKELRDKYAYSQLYNASPKEISEHRERDRFVLSGEYRYAGQASSADLQLHRPIRAGSLIVKHAGRELTEGVDYIVDYLSGQVEVINAQILSSNQSIEVSIDQERNPSAMRRTILGADLVYAPASSLKLGASVMHLSELSDTDFPAVGFEPMNNTLWGTSLHYQSESPWLQRALNWLPIAAQQKPASIALVAEAAHLHVGQSSSRQGAGYIDDFDHTMSAIELIHPAPWHLASRPVGLSSTADAGQTGISSGMGRGLLSWYRIDPIFSRSNHPLTPDYVRQNPELVSHHYIREVEMRELYPLRGQELTGTSYLPTLNLSYYPDERGPYNLETDRVLPDGKLAEAERSWAGIMRSIEQSDFEQAGIEYLEFWLMDPFVYNPISRGGVLSIHLGEISEDILSDGLLSFEQGGQLGGSRQSPWGKIPAEGMLARAFDQDHLLRRAQDVGLNGLSSEQEQSFGSYLSYLNSLRTKLSSNTLARWREQKHSPLLDPAGDDFTHYRDPQYDLEGSPILERYKYHNGLEGNSSASSTSSVGSSLIGQAAPDSEDINQDNTLNISNRYYEYQIDLKPELMQVGQGYIVGKRKAEVLLRNGTSSSVDWYLYRVPIRSYSRSIGGIQDFRSMRFIRLLLSNFGQRQDLRFGALRLVRGSWKPYERPLSDKQANSNGHLSLSSVSLEEHADRTPINYIPPPGQIQRQSLSLAGAKIENEKALAMRIERLAPSEARAAYRTIQYDMRPYKYLELLSHAERLHASPDAEDGALELFIRLGSDMQSNYYEYSIPLRFTAERRYSLHSEEDRRAVWPEENALRIPLEALTRLKTLRSQTNSSSMEYSIPDPSRPKATMKLRGTPSLASVQTIMLGLRNVSTVEIDAEVWINELRLSGLQDNGGWGANAQLSLGLSDLGSAILGGSYTSAGFGSLEQTMHDRTQEAHRHLHFSTHLDLGKLFPPKVQISFPLQYSRSNEYSTPKYDPRHTDLLLKHTLEEAANKHVRDSLLSLSTREREIQSLSITGARLNIQSKQPMPYDPANFSFTYIHNETRYRSTEVERQRLLNWQLGVLYDYAPTFSGLRPFSRLSASGEITRYLREYRLKLWPDKLLLRSTLSRSYQEDYMRASWTNVEATLPGTFAQDFVWNRGFNATWRFTPNLTATLAMGTDARIEEPHGQVDRVLNPDGYVRWRNEVLRSISRLGTPLRYNQANTLTYSLPTAQFSKINWITGQLSYSGTYQWDRGSILPTTQEELPAQVRNQSSLDVHIGLRLSSLYSKSPRLRTLEKRLSTTSRRDTTHKSLEDRLLHTLLMVRDLQFTYRQTGQTLLPTFTPSIGNWGGQATTQLGLAPGIPFALGLTDDSFIHQAKEKGWLDTRGGYAEPAIYTQTRTLEMKATLRPIAGLYIHLNSHYAHTERSEHTYIYEGQPIQRSGELTMTTIGLRGFWDTPSPSTGYQSSTSREIQDYIGHLQSPPKDTHLAQLRGFRRVYELFGSRLQEGNTSPIPHLFSSLPNWRITYTSAKDRRLLGLRLRSLTLSHSYRGIHRINNYLLQSTTNTSPYDISSISLQESFFPLLGIELSLQKGFSLSTQWRKQRGITLYPSALRLIESQSTELSLALSYRLADIRALWRGGGKHRISGKGLVLRGEISHKDNINLIRQLASGNSLATLGSREDKFNFSVEYELSRMLLLKGFYESSHIRPRVSRSTYPTHIKLYGLSLRLTLGD